MAILGAGGHARVVKEALQAMGREVSGCYDHNEMAPGRELALGVGSRSKRVEIVNRMGTKWIWPRVVHPSAVMPRLLAMGFGAQVMMGAAIQPDVNIGEFAIINTGAIVDHGCRVGKFAHICPGAILCGDVVVDDYAMVYPGQVVPRGTHIKA